MTDHLVIKDVSARVHAEHAYTATLEVALNRRPTETESALSRMEQHVYTDPGDKLPVPSLHEASDSFTFTCPASDVEGQLHAYSEGLRILSDNAAHLASVLADRRREVADQVASFLTNS